MNFLSAFERGQNLQSMGYYMGKGLHKFYMDTGGVLQRRIWTVASASKLGKSTYVNDGWVLSPYIDWLENHKDKTDKDIEWIYLSYEIDRVTMEFDFATYFLYHDYGIEVLNLDEGQTVKGKPYVELSPRYLKGHLISDQGNLIKVRPKVVEVLKKVYEDRIVPLFGRYDDKGRRLEKGKITFISNPENPTGLNKKLMSRAAKYGKFTYQSWEDERTGEKGNRVIGYTPDNPNMTTLIICDHVRKIPSEQGFNKKMTVDKYYEYCVLLRNLLGYSFVNIIHTNRNMTDTDRRKFAKDALFPTSEDIKDTSNGAEDSDYVITLFNPNDEKWNLNSHFGMPIKGKNGNSLYPGLRTLHLTENRHGECPIHFKTILAGNLKTILEFKDEHIK